MSTPSALLSVLLVAATSAVAQDAVQTDGGAVAVVDDPADIEGAVGDIADIEVGDTVEDDIEAESEEPARTFAVMRLVASRQALFDSVGAVMCMASARGSPADSMVARRRDQRTASSAESQPPIPGSFSRRRSKRCRWNCRIRWWPQRKGYRWRAHPPAPWQR